MATLTFGISDRGPASAARPRSADECLRHRLDVVASSAADVVESAGGWLYDRVMAGWQVTVLLPRGGDPRSLRILGVQVSDSRSWDPTVSRCRSLAASAEAFSDDARVRDRVLESLDDQTIEVALWGDGWPLRVNRATARAQHVLSAAARRFKAQALKAAGFACETIEPTETLLCDARARIDAKPIRLD